MKRRRKIEDLKVGQLVVLNDREDAVLWRVTKLEPWGNVLIAHMIDAELELTYKAGKLAAQEMDASLLQRPTKKQLEGRHVTDQT